jgi:replication factor C subunit 1
MVGSSAATLAAWLTQFGTPKTKRAALLSGPPGIGKTTMAHLVAKEQGFHVLEMNASDVRGKCAIASQLGSALKSKCLMGKRVIIMDEVDGCDRGGVPELIAIIKTTNTPIICICNNRYDAKLRTLTNYCVDIRIPRPTKTLIVEHLMKIAKAEDLELDAADALDVVEESGHDIRQAINCLQIGIIDAKDRQQSPFEACSTILGAKKGALDARYDSFFADSLLVPLLVQQNYVCPDASLNRLSLSADAISDMDLFDPHRDQHWDLMPAQAMCAVRAGYKLNGFPAFPAWLGKTSTENKRRKLIKEMSPFRTKGCDDYVNFWRAFSLKRLEKGDNASIMQVVDMLDAYGLTRDDLMESMQVGYKDEAILTLHVSSKTKAALTREYNKRHPKATNVARNCDEDDKSDADV